VNKPVVKSSSETKNDASRGVNVLSLRIVTLHAKLEDDHVDFIHGTWYAVAHGGTAVAPRS
jgi:hypothetical protein